MGICPFRQNFPAKYPLFEIETRFLDNRVKAN